MSLSLQSRGKMSQGRGSAYETAIVGLAVMYLLAQAKVATYVVGGSEGWTFNMENWPNGKSFRAGDTLSKFLLSPHILTRRKASPEVFHFTIYCTQPLNISTISNYKERISYCEHVLPLELPYAFYQVIRLFSLLGNFSVFKYDP